MSSLMNNIDGISLSSKGVTSSSTRLHLNNLVEFYFPFRTSDHLTVTCKHAPNNQSEKESELYIEIGCNLPCSVLAQRVDLEIEDIFSAKDDFANVFSPERVMYEPQEGGFGVMKQAIMIRRPGEEAVGHGQPEESYVIHDPIYIQEDLLDEGDLVQEESGNRQILRFVAISTSFKIILKVKEHFGFTASSNPIDESDQDSGLKEENKKSMIGEEIRSISRSFQHDEERKVVSSQSVEGPSSMNGKPQFNPKESEEIFQRAIMSIVKGIRVYAWPCFRIPASNTLIPLMNTAFLFETKRLKNEKRDIDFLAALSLISGRKFIQACEIFRKLQGELLKTVPLTQGACDKAIQLEILIADSMNQHSQLRDKISAFQRAVDLSQKKKVTSQGAGGSQNSHIPINEEEAHSCLMRLHPHIVKILLQNLDTKIEALKVAVLKCIEFILDQLGCSMDQYLVHILVSVIKSYPRSNFQNQQQAHLLQGLQITNRLGFFQEVVPSTQPNQISSEIKFENAYETSFLNSVLFNPNNEGSLVIKDGQAIQVQYISSIKNLQNHILESFISLLSSMSSGVLHQLFYEVILKVIFLQNTTNPFEHQLATDLRIYLLKIMDKIVTICSGDLVLPSAFLNQIVDCIHPSEAQQREVLQKKSSYLGGNSLAPQTSSLAGVTQEQLKAKQKANQTISLACQNLWSTFKTKLFANYSSKGLKVLLEWIFNKLVTLAEVSDEQKSLTQEQNQKLTLVFELIEVITNIRGVEGSKAKEARSESRQGHGSSDHLQQRSLVSLELYALINPLIFWLDYAIERPDRLALFKQVWRTLSRLFIKLPQDKLDLDLPTIILPVLQRVSTFCKTSSPPLEMIQFLSTVFQEFIAQLGRDSNPVSSQMKRGSRRDLQRFLSHFLVTLARCIPHHLNEEIFQLTEEVIELNFLLKGGQEKKSSKMQRDERKAMKQHVRCLVEALTDKYTMRSKAHKRLTKFFIQRVVLEESMSIVMREEQEKEEQRKASKRAAIQVNRDALINNQILNRSLEYQQPASLDHLMQHRMNPVDPPRFEHHQGYMTAVSIASHGSAAAPHSSFPQRGARGHNNNDLGLVVNNDDVELSREFNHQQEIHREAMLGYDDEDEGNSSAQEQLGYDAEDIGAVRMIPSQYEMDPLDNRIMGNDTEQTNEDVDDDTEIVDFRNHGGNFVSNQQLQGTQIPAQIFSQNIGNPDGEASDHQQQHHQRVASQKTSFDYFIVLCLIKLEKPQISTSKKVDKHLELLNQEKFVEKLQLFLQCLKAITADHAALFYKLLKREDQLSNALEKNFIDEQRLGLSQVSSIVLDIVETLSKYFMTHSLPKNVHEHSPSTLQRAKDLICTGFLEPLNQPQGVNHHHAPFLHHQQMNNNNQNSQSSGHQQQQNQLNANLHMQGGQSSNFFSSSHPVLFSGQLGQNVLRSPVHSQQHLQQMTQMHRQVGSHHVHLIDGNHGGHGHGRPGGFMIDDDFIMGTDLEDHMNDDELPLIDDVEVLNKDRLLLIKIHTNLAKLAMDTYQGQPGTQVHLQFAALNLLDNLFSNLLPIPSLMNMIMKYFNDANRELMANGPRPRILSNSILSQSVAQSEIGGLMSSNNPMHRESRQSSVLPDQANSSFYFDLERQTLVDNRRVLRNVNQHEAENFKRDFESTDMQYLEGRMLYALKVWKFLEDSLKSSWSTIRSISFGVICQVIKGASAMRLKANDSVKSLSKLKSLVMPLVNTLLNSKESESKAGGLNMLGSLCGLGLDLGLIKYSRTFKLNESLNLFRNDYQPNFQSNDFFCISGSRLIQVSLWQKLFQLSEEDWDTTIRDAASVLIQVCAPRLSIMQFVTIAEEKFDTKLHQMISEFQVKRTELIQSRLSTHLREPINRDLQGIAQLSPEEDASNDGSSSSRSSNREESKSNGSSQSSSRSGELHRDLKLKNYFYIDSYSDEQLQEIFAIFRNDYKPPPKNLWVEKNLAMSNQATTNQEGLGTCQHGGESMVDVFEDRIVDRLNKLFNQSKQGGATDGSNLNDQAMGNSYDSSKQAMKKKGNDLSGEAEYLIFERHFDDKKDGEDEKRNDADSSSQGATDSANHDEDLGIIDLDELEGTSPGGGGIFDDQFDDDKLPVLKNTYTKKHRPNNSKSVAIGSKTQNIMMMNTHQTQNPSLQEELKVSFNTLGLDRPVSAGRRPQLDQQHLIEKSRSQKALLMDNASATSSQITSLPQPYTLQQANTMGHIRPTSAGQHRQATHDKIIEEYEQRIAQSIASLSTQLKGGSSKPKAGSQAQVSLPAQQIKSKVQGAPDLKIEFLAATRPEKVGDGAKDKVSGSKAPQVKQAFSPSNSSCHVLKSRTPKEDSLMAIKAQPFSSSVEDTKKNLNLCLEASSAHPSTSLFDHQGSSKTSINIDTQHINVSLTQGNPIVDKEGLLRRALGEDKKSNTKPKQNLPKPVSLKPQASQVPFPPTISISSNYGPLVSSIASGSSSRRYTAPPKAKHAGLQTVTSSFATSVQNQKSAKRVKKPGQPTPPNGGIQKASPQSQFMTSVSRAKSQSYLNATGTGAPQGTQTPVTAASQVLGNSKKKNSSSFKSTTRYPRGGSNTEVNRSTLLPSGRSMLLQPCLTSSSVDHQTSNPLSAFRTIAFNPLAASTTQLGLSLLSPKGKSGTSFPLQASSSGKTLLRNNFLIEDEGKTQQLGVHLVASIKPQRARPQAAYQHRAKHQSYVLSTSQEEDPTHHHQQSEEAQQILSKPTSEGAEKDEEDLIDEDLEEFIQNDDGEDDEVQI